MDDVVRAVPQFVRGEDLTGSALRQALQIDLRPFRSDIEAWLTKAGRLLVESVSEAVQAQVVKLMEPAVNELFEGQEYEKLMERIGLLESSFGAIQEFTETIKTSIDVFSTVSDENAEVAAALQNLTGSIQTMSVLGIEGVRKGKTVLEQASKTGITDWARVIESVTAEMLSEIKSKAKTITDAFAQDFTTAVFGTGVHTVPEPARILLVEQVRPLQLVVSPVISSGTSILSIMNAGLFTGVLLIVLAAGRIRRIACWAGFTGIIVSFSASAFAAGLTSAAEATAKAIGGIGGGMKEVGMVVGWMMNMARKGVEFFLDVEIEEFKSIDGWTTDDVLNSLTYGVIQTDILDRLSDWASAVMTWALFAIALDGCTPTTWWSSH